MAEVTPEVLLISKELYQENGIAEQWLRSKCRLLQMSRTKVIRLFGDPRKLLREDEDADG